SKEGIIHISMTYLQEGDEVLVPDPGYPAYAAATQLTGATARFYDLNAERKWLPDLDELEATNLSHVKLMWVNYPHMPSGAKASESFFKALVDFGARNNILICHDNPYSFILNDKPQSLLKAGVNEHVIELNSLSKSHNMAGWRVGMLAGAQQHIDHILTFKSNVDSGTFLPVQLAAIEALRQDQTWYQQLNTVYKQRKNIVFQILDELESTYSSNQAGMFVWAKVPDHVSDVAAWVDQLIEESEVFITPGFIFGKNGSRYVRISLCQTEKIIRKALTRIKNRKK
ncbi:MAG: aminotransferase class I/II-fold pyridoxal phosphate-dependent enzyme, partial [Fulvivirga sp.]|nr:aminotransferase class I/II-fold pyridoxal phosphate-dependent enzyme [Fulvivirga sp.]